MTLSGAVFRDSDTESDTGLSVFSLKSLGKFRCLYCSFTNMTKEKMQSRSGTANSLSSSGSFLDHGCKQGQNDIRVVHGDRTLAERIPQRVSL